MLKEYVTVFFCKDGTTEEHWWPTEQEAINHANMFTDSDDGDIYDKIEVQYKTSGYGYDFGYVDTLHTLKPWEQAS